MLVKVAILFLAGMLALALFGRSSFFGRKAADSRKCPKCGRHRIGRGPCDCGHRG